MTLGSTLSDIWHRFQGELFPALAEEVGPLLEVHKRFVTALDLVKVERFVGEVWNGPGRPQEDRRALARAFIAKAVWDLPTTRHLIDRLKVDPTLRRLCGWSRVVEIPSEATFSRARLPPPACGASPSGRSRCRAWCWQRRCIRCSPERDPIRTCRRGESRSRAWCSSPERSSRSRWRARSTR